MINIIVQQDFTSQFRDALKQTTQSLLDMSRIAVSVRDEYGYKILIDWLKDEFGLSRQTGDNLLNIHKTIIMSTLNFSVDSLEKIGPSALYLLSAPSTPDIAREEAIERAEGGERITYSTAQEIVSSSRTENRTPDNNWYPMHDDRAEAGPQEPEYAAPTPMPHVAYNAGNNEWYTPPQYILAARRVMGDIDLDPASSDVANAIVGADTFYTAENDGLRFHWQGRVWMNPPYSTEFIGPFCKKLVLHIAAGDVTEAIVLVNNSTDTGWFQQMLGVCAAVCFVKGRVRFLDPEGNPGAPLQGQAILYFGGNAARFVTEFAQFGSARQWS